MINEKTCSFHLSKTAIAVSNVLMTNDIFWLNKKFIVSYAHTHDKKYESSNLYLKMFIHLFYSG